MGSGIEATVTFIGLGSNLGDRVGYLRAAINAIKQLGDSMVLSSLYESEPFGVGDDVQPMYLNMALSLRTALTPKQLLSELMDIEQTNGRVRSRRNESRTLDLDILMYGDDVIESSELIVPHPRMHERAFVMLPMSEIAPQLVHPSLGLTMSEIARKLDDQGIRRVGTIDDAGVLLVNPASKPE